MTCPHTDRVIEISHRRLAMGGRPIRHRVGVWLLKPYVAKLIQHYNAAADKHAQARDYERERNCEYITIGLKHALEEWEI